MSITTTTSVLPMDIVNRIVQLSVIQQDKFYVPYFHQNGRCSWKRNRQSSQIQKIENMLLTKLRYPPKHEIIHLEHRIYSAITYTLSSDGNGNYLEYSHCETNIAEAELYFMKRWTYILLNNDYRQYYLVDGLIYNVYNRGYTQPQGKEPEYWNGCLFHKRTFREINTGDYWEFYGIPSTMGKYILDTKTNIYEFIMNKEYTDRFEDRTTEAEDPEPEELEEEVEYGNSGYLSDDFDALW